MTGHSGAGRGVRRGPIAETLPYCRDAGADERRFLALTAVLRCPGSGGDTFACSGASQGGQLCVRASDPSPPMLPWSA